jgi:hypothetical protein
MTSRLRIAFSTFTSVPTCQIIGRLLPKMAFAFILPIRLAQAVLAFIILCLLAYGKHVTGSFNIRLTRINHSCKSVVLVVPVAD